MLYTSLQHLALTRTSSCRHRCVDCPLVNITGSTFVHNSGTYGGGLYLSANLTSRNRVLSSNFTANNATDSSGLGADPACH